MTDNPNPAPAAVRIAPGGAITIDTDTWIRRRIRGLAPELTRDLLTWAYTYPNAARTPSRNASSDPAADLTPAPGGGPTSRPSGAPARRNWALVARLWCVDRGFRFREPDLIEHTSTRLRDPVWVLRAYAGRERSPIAVIGTGHHWNRPRIWHAGTAQAGTRPAGYDDGRLPDRAVPAVCRDAADAWTWLDADSVTITCPGGHHWTWRTGRELVTADGRVTTVTVVWGPDLNAPFTECPQCAAHRSGSRAEPCGCGGLPWVICPSCRRRCQIDLPPPPHRPT